MPKIIEGKLKATGKKYAIVASRWNEFITKQLVEGALRAFRMHGGDENVQIVWVSGAWEIPVAVRRLVEDKVDAIVCVGCILQGATVHASLLSQQVMASLVEISIKTGIPITYGILTCATQEEAIERAGLKQGNKGEEAARAAIEMVSVLEQVK